jgi:hypothetical protein
VADGMRSGNSFIVHGDLIKGLGFSVSDGEGSATMGGTLDTVAGKPLNVTISVRSPRINRNEDRVRLDHVDVITGAVTGRIAADDPAYLTSVTNPSAKVAKTFSKKNWKVKSGWKVMTYRVKAGTDMYLRLRGTNLRAGTPNQTDARGNPLVDTLDYVGFPNFRDGGVANIRGNTPANAWADLWFYSNPIFVDVE